MRRRVDDADPPEELLVFTGIQYAGAEQWLRAFDDWHEQRRRWCERHGWRGDLPQRVVGDCPWSPDWI